MKAKNENLIKFYSKRIPVFKCIKRSSVRR